MGKFIDLSGKKFGTLNVVGQTGRTKHKAILWECLCDCGSIRHVVGQALRTGHTKTCGECRGNPNRRTNAYKSWRAMMGRVSPSSPGAKNYSNKGITVCDRWKDFNNFFADMGERESNLTIDRIDNSKGYEPGNCRWATYTTQARNKTNNALCIDDVETIRFLSEIGISQKEIARVFGVKPCTVSNVVNGVRWSGNE